MNRRRLLVSACSLALMPSLLRADDRVPVFADMHSHAGVGRRLDTMHSQMADNRMLIVARAIATDRPVTQTIKGRITVVREAQPGELAANFEKWLQRLHENIQREGVATIDSAAVLEEVIARRKPAAVIAAEGGDFLEGDLKRLEEARKNGLVHLQLVHYRVSEIGDISTEAPRYNGLTPFGREVVAACNRLGILIDVAHGTSAVIEQTLAISRKPVIYSHGQVTSSEPYYTHRVAAARSIHLPVARKIAQKGGVVGIWANSREFPTLERYGDALLELAGELGVAHAGIGTDMNGMTYQLVPSYREYNELAEVLAKRNIATADIEGLLGGNYIRVLKSALNV